MEGCEHGTKLRVNGVQEKVCNQIYRRLSAQAFKGPFDDHRNKKKPYIWSQKGEWKLAVVDKEKTRYPCSQLPWFFHRSKEPESRPETALILRGGGFRSARYPWLCKDAAALPAADKPPRSKRKLRSRTFTRQNGQDISAAGRVRWVG